MPRARVSRSRLTPLPADHTAELSAYIPVKPAKKALLWSWALSVDTLEGLGARRLAELLMNALQG